MSPNPLTPEAFNKELRAWVKKVTGKADGGAALRVSRSTFYRNTQGDRLLSWPDLEIVVDACTSRIGPAEREIWARRWLARWQEAYAARSVADYSHDRPPATGPESIDAPSRARFLFPRARVAPLESGPVIDGVELETLLNTWRRHPTSNLFFLSGTSGSGKTTEARAWVGANPDVRYGTLLDEGTDLLQQLHDGTDPGAASGKIVVIDDFDLVTMPDGALTRPDLRTLRGFLGRKGRCVVLSKRNLRTDRDELAEQLRSPSRLDDLGVVDPFVYRMLPVAAEELDATVGERDDPKLASLAAELDRVGSLMLATPMVLRQLYETTEDGVPAPRTQWDAYTVYIKHVCGQPWDRSSSRIPSQVRFRTYRDIAWDMFAGREHPMAHQRQLIAVPRVAEWLQENMHRDLDLTRQRDYLTYEWTSDLLRHAEIFGATERTTDSVESAAFTHSTFYKYFVAEAIRDRLRDQRGLGLDGAQFVDATLSRLITSFVKAGFREGDLDAVALVCSRKGLSWMDRLICLYLAEERADFGDLLGCAPDGYLDELETVRHSYQSLFMRKVATFQLVVSGRVPADEYLDVVRREENNEAEDRERDVLGAVSDVTSALVRRLHSPPLDRAIPIAIYRLGQMGDITSVGHLEALARDRPEHRDGALEAIGRIKERNDRRP